MGKSILLVYGSSCENKLNLNIKLYILVESSLLSKCQLKDLKVMQQLKKLKSNVTVEEISKEQILFSRYSGKKKKRGSGRGFMNYQKR